MFFFFNDTATTEIYTLSLHDALPISDATDPGHVSESRRREEKIAPDEDPRGDEDADRRGSGAPGERRGPARQGARQCRAERHRVPRRDPQDHNPPQTHPPLSLSPCPPP